jgi:endonuclease YncB( thermonuclease family)
MIRKTKFRFQRRAPSLRPTRHGTVRALWLVPLLLLVGAMFDPALVAPFGPLAAPAEVVSATFSRCSRNGSPACVADGETFRLGTRTIRITGIDAPELAGACTAEAVLARKSRDRLIELLNQGEFRMIAHRLQRKDGFGRELMVVEHDGQSIGDQLRSENLARRYIGPKGSWC